MTQWEYKTLVTCFWRDTPLLVSVDGESKESVEGNIIKKTYIYPPLAEYLKELGLAGWEVVGISPTQGSEGGNINILVILKRPIQQDEE